MTTADTAIATAIIILFLLSIVLAVAETALTRISKARAHALAETSGRRGEVLLSLVENQEWLNPTLLLVLSTQLVQSTLLGVLASRLFGGWGVLLATVLNVTLFFVIAEVAPKTWAIQHTDRAALAFARPIKALAGWGPLRLLSRGLIGTTNVLLPGKGLKRGPYTSEEELLAVADLAVEDLVIAAEERDFIQSVIELGDTVVREVMLPRTDMITVSAAMRVADAMEVVILNGYSRIPVCGEGIDDVVGVAHAKDLMRAERAGQEHSAVSTLARPARFVPETKGVADLLREMQRDHYHLAIVIDEYGGTAGLVTLEDIIEELLGEIVDEFDVEHAMSEPLPGGDFRVNARMPIDEVNQLIHAHLPEGDWDTLGGLFLSKLGHVPAEGEWVEVEGWQLIAQGMQGRRIGGVRIHRIPAADPSSPEAVEL